MSHKNNAFHGNNEVSMIIMMGVTFILRLIYFLAQEFNTHTQKTPCSHWCDRVRQWQSCIVLYRYDDYRFCYIFIFIYKLEEDEVLYHFIHWCIQQQQQQSSISTPHDAWFWIKNFNTKTFAMYTHKIYCRWRCVTLAQSML